MNILFTYAKNTLKGGLLYNKPAVEDARGLAPTDWRVANINDYMNLINYSGGEAVAGGEMKALQSWTAPNSGATAESKFKALPAGTRSPLGVFADIFNKTIFWIKAL